MKNSGTPEGARIAVVGGGVSGAALAAAILFTARARGRQVEVRVYEGAKDESAHRPPAILTPECRSRLAALGCRIPPEWSAQAVDGVEVISRRSSEFLPSPAGGIWIVDGWPRICGQSLITQSLAQVAAFHGARFVSRHVDHVEKMPVPGGKATVAGPGTFVVRAQGGMDRFHSVAIATGAAPEDCQTLFPGFSGAPVLPAAHARVSYTPFLIARTPRIRLILSPLPGVEGLYLIPCRESIYAFAYGPSCSPADLCQALMMAARDGHLPEGFELHDLGTTCVPNGVSRRLVGPGQLAVGPAALGHPLQLGVSETLATASRAAVAMVEAGDDERQLRRRYLDLGIGDMISDVRMVVRSTRWLRWARGGAAAAFARARTVSRGLLDGGGVLGLSSPSAVRLLQQGRREALHQGVRRLWRSAVDPVPPVFPKVERELFYVVDDDPQTRDALTEYLEERGAEVVSFADELALFCAVARRPPSAILLDVVLNWVDGLRLCEELKRHPLTRNTRVFVMSGLNRPHIRERAERAGAEAFLPKPVDPQRLWSRLSGENGGQAVRPETEADAAPSSSYAS